MKFKNRSLSTKRIAYAAVEDAISYIVGLSGFPAPVSSLKQLWMAIHKTAPQYFVDWELRQWPSLYEGEVSNCLSLLFEDKSYRIPHVKVIDNCDQVLPLSSFVLRVSNDYFSLDSRVRSLTEPSFEKLLKFLKKKGRFINEINLRPRSINFSKGKYYIDCQQVYYRDFVHTNLLLDAKDKSKSITLREMIHEKKCLESISESLLANHLGIEALLFTSDGSIILQVRSKRVAFRAGQLCAAASGAVSVDDAAGKTIISLDQVRFSELFEEIGVRKDHMVPESIFCLGLTRVLSEAENPNFLCQQPQIFL